MVSNRRPYSFNLIFGNSKKLLGANSGSTVVGDDSHFLFRQKHLDEDGSVRRGVVMVKQPIVFSSNFVASSSHVFTHSSQNVAVEPDFHSLACWDKLFVLPQLLHRWRHQYGIFWIPFLIVGIIIVGFSSTFTFTGLRHSTLPLRCK
jgi:hypothetical protein